MGYAYYRETNELRFTQLGTQHQYRIQYTQDFEEAMCTYEIEPKSLYYYLMIVSSCVSL